MICVSRDHYGGEAFLVNNNLIRSDLLDTAKFGRTRHNHFSI
jgi:hypothetical protein